MSILVNNINKRLQTVHGVNDYGQPMFRIVFSDDQLEKRFGKYAEFYGPIFIREFSGLRENKKYWYIQHKWVLERWMPSLSVYDRMIPGTSEGSYEPIYVFQDANGNPLPVVEEVANRVIHTLFNPKLPGDRASDLKAEEEKEMTEEIKHFEDVIADAGGSWLNVQMHGKEAVGYTKGLKDAGDLRIAGQRSGQ